VLIDPVAGGEFEEQGAVQPARVVIIDILDAGRMAKAGGFGAGFEALLPTQCRRPATSAANRTSKAGSAGAATNLPARRFTKQPTRYSRAVASGPAFERGE
jgi:hypothetical protein